MRTGPCDARRSAASRLLPLLVALALSAASCLDDPGRGAAPAGARPAGASSTAPTTSVAAPSTSARAAEPSDAELMRDVRPSIVRIRSTTCEGVGVGTGWSFEGGRVVTNRHVAEASSRLELETWDGRDVPVASAATVPTADLAAIAVAADGPLRPLPVRTTPVEPGERIAILGYPGGGELSVSTGVALEYTAGEEGTADGWLRATTVVHPGNSGGPAVDMQGRAVGVVFAELVRDDAVLIIPIDEVLAKVDQPLDPVVADC